MRVRGPATLWALVCALVVAAPAGLTAAGVRDWRPLVATSAAVAVVGVFASRVSEQIKREDKRRDEQAFAVERGCLVLRNGRLPLVRQVGNPLLLGVHRAIEAPAGAAELPPYVPRDRDGELRRALAAGGFTLLVGDSTAGKSRSAYEAMRVTLPGHTLIAPENLDALPDAVERAKTIGRCVLWLDDLERYLGAGGLSRTVIGQLTADPRRVILGTMRAAEMDRFTGVDDDEAAARSPHGDHQAALEQATVIRLNRQFTQAEIRRAADHAADARIANALEHAGAYGLTEYLAAGPELDRDWHNAWDSGHPRAAALIAAAVDCRRAGLTGPLPRALLERTHERYLDRRGGARLRPEGLDMAWAWALKPRRATTALLEGDDARGYRVFDYLVDQAQRHGTPDTYVPEETIVAAIAYASAAEADSLGNTAYSQGHYQTSAAAARKAFDENTRAYGRRHAASLVSANNLATSLGELGQLAEAADLLRQVLTDSPAVFGNTHPTNLSVRSNLATVLRDLGELDEAESLLRETLAVSGRALDPTEPDMLATWNIHATVLRDLGWLDEAEKTARTVLNTSAMHLGVDHAETLAARHTLATILQRRGQWDAAEAEHRAVLTAREETLRPDHPDTVASRESLAEVLRRKGAQAPPWP